MTMTRRTMAWRDSSAFCAAVAGAARGRFVMRRRLLKSISVSDDISLLLAVHCFTLLLPSFLGSGSLYVCHNSSVPTVLSHVARKFSSVALKNGPSLSSLHFAPQSCTRMGDAFPQPLFLGPQFAQEASMYPIFVLK